MGIVGRAIDGGGSGAATNPSSALKKPSRRQGVPMMQQGFSYALGD